MVWGLYPDESLRGCHKYYIFAKGTYKVGRKDCDVTVQTDTAVSRLHSEIVIDEMISGDFSPKNERVSGVPSHVRIVDRSKFGTWVNKEAGAKAVRLRENEEAKLEDGDFLTFGTGNATFRLCFVPLMFYIHNSKRVRGRLNPSIKAAVSSIGACATTNWSPQCTHILVEQSAPVTDDIIEAVIQRKPILLISCIKALEAKRIDSELLSFERYVPTLELDGTSVKIIDLKSRDNCLESYTFVLGSSDKYSFGDKLRALLEIVGAKVVPSDEFCFKTQSSTVGESAHFVLISGDLGNEFDQHLLGSLSRCTEIKLVAAVLSGQLESSVIEPPAYVVSSSHSTDETVVPDSEAEVDAVTSNYDVSIARDFDGFNKTKSENTDIEKSLEKEDIIDYKEKKDDSASGLQTQFKILNPNDGSSHSLRKVEKNDESKYSDELQKIDIIFSQELVVRSVCSAALVRSTPKDAVNFKCFKKKNIVSGNSFKNLIPFSRDPYEEYNHGDERSNDHMREERKRKQMEAMAEDLFNNEKKKKRVASATASASVLRTFLSR